MLRRYSTGPLATLARHKGTHHHRVAEVVELLPIRQREARRHIRPHDTADCLHRHGRGESRGVRSKKQGQSSAPAFPLLHERIAVSRH